MSSGLKGIGRASRGHRLSKKDSQRQKSEPSFHLLFAPNITFESISLFPLNATSNTNNVKDDLSLSLNNSTFFDVGIVMQNIDNRDSIVHSCHTKQIFEGCPLNDKAVSNSFFVFCNTSVPGVAYIRPSKTCSDAIPS